MSEQIEVATLSPAMIKVIFEKRKIRYAHELKKDLADALDRLEENEDILSALDPESKYYDDIKSIRDSWVVASKRFKSSLDRAKESVEGEYTEISCPTVKALSVKADELCEGREIFEAAVRPIKELADKVSFDEFNELCIAVKEKNPDFLQSFFQLVEDL